MRTTHSPSLPVAPRFHPARRDGSVAQHRGAVRGRGGAGPEGSPAAPPPRPRNGSSPAAATAAEPGQRRPHGGDGHHPWPVGPSPGWVSVMGGRRGHPRHRTGGLLDPARHPCVRSWTPRPRVPHSEDEQAGQQRRRDAEQEDGPPPRPGRRRPPPPTSGTAARRRGRPLPASSRSAGVSAPAAKTSSAPWPHSAQTLPGCASRTGPAITAPSSPPVIECSISAQGPMTARASREGGAPRADRSGLAEHGVAEPRGRDGPRLGDGLRRRRTTSADGAGRPPRPGCR